MSVRTDTAELATEADMVAHGRDGEADDKGYPHALGPKSEGEGQHDAQRQGHQQIGDIGDAHGYAHILDAAEHRRTDALEAVGILKQTGNQYKRAGNGNNLGVGGEDIGQVVAERNHQEGADGVHREAEVYRSPRGHTDRLQVAFAQLVRDADGSGRTDAQGQHEGEVGHLVGDMVGGQRLLANPADDDERGREEKSLHEGLETNRHADTDEAGYLLATEHPALNQRQVLAPVAAEEHDAHKTDGRQRAGDEGGQSGTLGTHRAYAAMAEDKDIVQQDIQEVAGHGDDHGDGGVADSLQELLAEAEKEKGHDGEHDEREIRAGGLNDIGFLTEEVQNRDTRRQKREGHNGDQKRENHAVSQKSRDAFLAFFGPDGIADKGCNSHQRAHSEDHDGKEQGVGETDCRQIRRTVMADHDTVKQTHQSRT